MTKEEFAHLVCENLSVDHNKVITSSITYKSLLEAIFVGKTIPETAKILTVPHRTMNTILNHMAFPMIDRAFAKPWRTRLLERIDYKTCQKCKEIKKLDDFFNKNNSGIKNRSDKSYICVVCDNKAQLRKYKELPHIHRAANNKNKALSLNPCSMDLANEVLIKKIYKECPDGYTVDHIIPFAKGGLHHEGNLCYLPSKLNLQKQAKLPEEVPEIMKYAIYPDLDNLS